MTREDVKVMIGDFREIENEKLLEKIIENYKDDDASYKEAYLILQNDEGNKSGDAFAVLDYETSFTVIDVYGNAQTYDEDDVSEQYDEIYTKELFQDFEYCCYDDRFYTLFKPLWKDIYYTIIEYGLDEEEFVRCFVKYTDDDWDVDYDVVQHFYNCLKNDRVSDFINEYYNPNLPKISY